MATRVTCDDIVIATHNPLVGLADSTGAALFQTKLALYTSYVIAGRAPRGTVPDALWWDTGDPYHYLRVEPHRDYDVVIFGGEDHKTGQQDDTGACYRRLEERSPRSCLRSSSRIAGRARSSRRPMACRISGESADHQYAATGYCRQRPDVRDAGRHDDLGRHPRPVESVDAICSIRAGRR